MRSRLEQAGQTMRVIGILFMIAGFIGIPAMGVVGVTRNIPAGVSLHLLVFAAYLGYLKYRTGSIAQTLLDGLIRQTTVNWVIVFLGGLVFTAIGFGIAIPGEPSSDPNSLSPDEKIYVGTVVALLGLGLVMMATGSLLANEKPDA